MEICSYSELDGGVLGGVTKHTRGRNGVKKSLGGSKKLCKAEDEVRV